MKPIHQILRIVIYFLILFVIKLIIDFEIAVLFGIAVIMGGNDNILEKVQKRNKF